jgi:hypothetical protein
LTPACGKLMEGEMAMTADDDRSARSVMRVRKLSEGDDAGDMSDRPVAERFEVMWQLALDAWAFKGEPVLEPRLPRHVTRVVRGGG